MNTRRFFVSIIALLGVLLVLAVLLRTGETEEIRGSVALSEAMAGDTAGYDRASEVRKLEFPEDYGPHPRFKTEWWYYTGNLESEAGRRFGYELTIFRSALAPPETPDGPDVLDGWATRQLFMGHFSLVDPEEGRFYAFERFSRGAAGLAGARGVPYRVWLEDWSIEATGDQLFPSRIRAQQEGVSMQLSLETAKPVVLQGDHGLDQKGPGAGSASYYYSFTRLPTEGTVSIDGRSYSVTGSSWKDHEWSTSALGEDQVGWDWFALQLSNGIDIMFYQLRRRDGTPSSYTNGIVVGVDGSTEPLSLEEVDIAVLDTWTSPHSGAVYPSGWQFRIPGKDLELRITPVVPDQELNVSVRYWEGAVDLEGTMGGGAVTGWGYVELTGYGDEPESRDTDRIGSTRSSQP